MRACFHIGLHKTGTTWFQDVLFPSLLADSRWKILGGGKASEEDVWAFLNGISASSLGSEFRFVSCEDLSGTIDLDRNPSDSWKKYNLFLSNVEQKELGVIIGFREHKSWLRSAYSQKAKKLRRPQSLKDYAESYSVKDLSWGLWSEILASKVRYPFIYFMDELTENPEGLVTDLARFLGVGVPENTAALAAEKKNPRIAGTKAMRAHQSVRQFGRSALGRALKKTVKHASNGRVRIKYEPFAKMVSSPVGWLTSQESRTAGFQLPYEIEQVYRSEMDRAKAISRELRGRLS